MAGIGTKQFWYERWQREEKRARVQNYIIMALLTFWLLTATAWAWSRFLEDHRELFDIRSSSPAEIFKK